MTLGGHSSTQPVSPGIGTQKVPAEAASLTRPRGPSGATILDCEVFKDYFAVGVFDVDLDIVYFIEMYEGRPFDMVTMRSVLKTGRIVTFNGNKFDLLLIAAALKGADCATLKKISDTIIRQNLAPYRIEEMFNVRAPKCDHVDLIELPIGRASLKVYGGRLHCQNLADLPFDPAASIDETARAVLRTYCENDLRLTARLLRELELQIALRETLSEQYGQDLRSKSDAQIAEYVIRAEVEKRIGHPIVKPTVLDGERFLYETPRFIGFQTEPLRAFHDSVRVAEFIVQANGKVDLPPALKTAVKIGDGRYRLGIGGLHSSEKSRAIRAADGELILDRDVTSYYPSIILNCGLYPQHMGRAFLAVYKDLYERRLAAKHAGDKVTADVLKIALNGSFGKFGSPYSILYSPHLLIQVTVTGQLALLMLIEHLELHGVRVVSANTDGIVIHTTADRYELIKNLVAGWELVTGFQTEETEYSALFSRDVNNYIALKVGGGVKLKGAYAPASLAKNPSAGICNEAVIEYLKSGRPIEDTVRDATDLREFIVQRKVEGGAVKDAVKLGRVVRWYYSTSCPGPIQYVVNGYSVAGSDNARPVQSLPGLLPDDIDHQHYINLAQEMLSEIGAL